MRLASVGAGDGKTTVKAYFLHWIELRKAQDIVSAKDDETRVKLHVLPEIGDMAMGEVRPRHIRDLVCKLRQKE